MEIAIIGLHARSIERGKLRRVDLLWTLNDWYTFIPWLKPHRIYQIHAEGFSKLLPKWRFIDWRSHYEKSGAEICCTVDLGFKKQVYFPVLRHYQKYGALSMSSSIAMMICDAIEMNPTKITIQGVKLAYGDEYQTQAPGVCHMIKKARESGIIVEASNESEWGGAKIPEDAGSSEILYGGVGKFIGGLQDVLR